MASIRMNLPANFLRNDSSWSKSRWITGSPLYKNSLTVVKVGITAWKNIK
jgi:hypothetical protein